VRVPRSAHRSAGGLYTLFAAIGLAGLAGVIIAATAALLMIRMQFPPIASILTQCVRFLMGLDPLAMTVLVVLGVAVVVVVRAMSSITRQLRADRHLRSTLELLGTIEIADTAVTVIADDRPEAFCMGYLRPRIYVSTGAFDRLGCDELDALIAHEQHHLGHRDPLRILLGSAAAEAMFFLPLLPKLLRRYRALAELAADEAAIERAGTRSLAGALLRFVGESHTPSTAVGLAPERIDHLSGQRPSWRFSGRWLLRWIVLSAGVLALVVVFPLLVAGHTLSSMTLFAQSCLIGMVGGPILVGVVMISSARRRFRARRAEARNRLSAGLLLDLTPGGTLYGRTTDGGPALRDNDAGSDDTAPR
jgi:Zn-dependent protease with chaperone function